MIQITPTIAIAEDEIVERFVRASGPGGQHVNTTDSAVQLRFDVRRSPSLADDVKERLQRLAGRRLTDDGVLVLVADEHRSQRLNRDAALARLVDLIRRAAVRPKTRRPTRPTLASKLKRVDHKVRRGGVKRGRRAPPVD